MRFGVQVEPQFGFNYNDVLKVADTAIQNGLSTVWFSDHFMLDKDATDKILLDPWLLMAALVRDNQEIRVGSLVFCNSYRHPPLHAKMAATLDVLSEGRLEFGIGAGWKEIEYNAYGYNFPDPYTRIDQLAEAVQIIRGIWTNDKFSFDGDYYSTHELVSFPKPVQNPHPKIWIGTMYARKKMLEVAAKYGDGINIAWSFSVEQCERIFRRLDIFAENNGRNPSDIMRSVGFWTNIFESEEDMEIAIVENSKKRGVSVDDYRDRINSALWGTPEKLVERLRKYKQLGVSEAIFMFPHEAETSQIELFGKQVVSKL